eukprot:TRINITY_DN10932_c0_g1_i4.p1 TRINITY_DN10932_c0_g1~~TRINITY_DN10932_c0_g1_i4.p1  ORF type:complete len:325 (-),score=51.13 TRINITY_DN10932_c0_g1_i4:61-1035(-)
MGSLPYEIQTTDLETNKMESILKVCITGAAGQIAYSLIPMLCSGELFGADQMIALTLLDLPSQEDVCRGIAMEVEDGAYPLVKSIEFGSNAREMFRDVDFAIFLGGSPRKPGMERRDLLQVNGQIFEEQGKALNEVAKSSAKVLVVANPVNTNCLILSSNAPNIPRHNFTCLTRLDLNRARAQIARKAGVSVGEVKNIVLWGNHSMTQYPDVNHGTIKGVPINEVIKDEKYLREEFIYKVQKRGGEVLSHRKISSIMSAAQAIKDHVKSWVGGTKEGEFVSMGVYSEGWYNIPKDIFYSFPVLCRKGTYEVVEGLSLDLSLIHI